jgi:hypothetical protein
MSRFRRPDSHNSPSDVPGTIHPMLVQLQGVAVVRIRPGASGDIDRPVVEGWPDLDRELAFSASWPSHEILAHAAFDDLGVTS